MRAATCLLVCLPLLSCAHLNGPDNGGPQWVRASSDHFDVVTDLPPGPAEALTRDLEEERAVMLAMAWPGQPEPPARFEVIVTRTLDELVQFSGYQFTDILLSHDVLGQPGVATHAQATRTRELMVRYWLARQLTLCLLPRAPLWLGSGLPAWLQTLRFDASTGLWTVGSVPEERLHNPPLQTYRHQSRMLMDLTGAAFARVHYLLTTRGPEFARYQQALRRGEPANAAFSSAFPDLQGEAFDPAASAHLAQEIAGPGHVYRLPPLPWRGRVQVAGLGNGAVHALFARLYRSGNSGRSRRVEAMAEFELRAALFFDPLDPSALLQGGLQGVPESERSERVRQVAGAHPEDARAHYLLALQAAPGSPEREAALRQTIERRPSIPNAWALLSEELRGRSAAEALQVATHAVELSPWLPRAAASLAAAQAATGACKDAVATRVRLQEDYGRPDGLGYDFDDPTRKTLAVVEELCR